MMERLWFLLIWLLAVLVCFGAGQEPLRARAGPWRHRIQWENNGQLYSLLSTGTEYRLPSQSRRRTQLFLTTKNSLDQIQPPAALSGSTRRSAGASGDQSEQMDAVLAADAGQYLTSGRPGTHSRTLTHQAPSNRTSIQEFSGGGVPRGGRSAPEDAQQASPAPARAHDLTQRRVPILESESSDSPPASVWVTWTEDQTRAQSLTRASPETSDSPPSSNAVEIHFPRRRAETTGDRRDPHSIHHRNSVFYNVYPPDRRNRQNGMDPAATGYGTRFFHNGEKRPREKSHI